MPDEDKKEILRQICLVYSRHVGNSVGLTDILNVLTNDNLLPKLQSLIDCVKIQREQEMRLDK